MIEARAVSWRATGLALLLVGLVLSMLGGLLLMDLGTSAASRGEAPRGAMDIGAVISGVEPGGRGSGAAGLSAGVSVTETGVLTVTALPDLRLEPSMVEGLIPAAPELSAGGESSQVIEPLAGSGGRMAAAAGDGCTPSPGNLVANPGFESGTSSWVFFTNGVGSMVASTPAYQCAAAARVSIDRVGSNMQLYQSGIHLKAGRRYRLSFAGYSTTGHDLRVFLLKNKTPFTNYGLRGPTFNLGRGWQQYSVEFTASGFSGEVSDARLSFSFVKKAAAGDIYWLDEIVLEEVVAEPAATFTATAETTPIDTPTPTDTPAPTDTPTPTLTPTATPTPTPSPTPGTGREILVYDWNKPVTTAERGFPRETPPRASANGNWTTPINYAEGTLYYRVEIFGMPVVKEMKLQFCFWQDRKKKENCGPLRTFWGNPGTVVTWSRAVKDQWKKDGVPIDWSRPRETNGVAIKTPSGVPVSDYGTWNWAGDNPDEWYPLNMRFTVVVVAKGSTFSGWENYVP